MMKKTLSESQTFCENMMAVFVLKYQLDLRLRLVNTQTKPRAGVEEKCKARYGKLFHFKTKTDNRIFACIK